MLSLSSLSLCNQIGSSSDPIHFGVSSIDSALPSQGLQRGAIHEFFYHDPLDRRALASTLPAILAYNSHSARLSCYHRSSWRTSYSTQPEALLPRILWIGKPAWPSPPALAALSTSRSSLVRSLFAHSLFINPPNEKATLWAIDLALRNSAVDLIVAACPHISRITTQRLSLAAQKHKTTAILLRLYNDLKTPSCAASRWTLTPTPSDDFETPSWKLSLTKLRGGLLLQPQWIVRLSAHDLLTSSFEPLTALQLTTQPSEEHPHRDETITLRYKQA